MKKNLKSLIQDLKFGFKGVCRLNELLSEHTTLKIGGPASLWLEPQDNEDLRLALNLINIHRVPFFILGNGSNILARDSGFCGVVIHLNANMYKKIDLEEKGGRYAIVNVGSGLELKRVLEFCVKHGLSGAEFMSGIPGRVGGALVMNAGINSRFKNETLKIKSISEITKEIKVMDYQGRRKTLNKENIKFGYRYSNLVNTEKPLLNADSRISNADTRPVESQRDLYGARRYSRRDNLRPYAFPPKRLADPPSSMAEDLRISALKDTFSAVTNLYKYIVLEAKLQFKIKDKDEIRDEMRSFIQYRKETQDISYPSAGCVFRNPDNQSAGRLIDLCGLKGRRIGDAQISSKHANFIVNLGHAKSSDVLALMRLINKKVRENFGITLKPEVRII